MSFILMCSTVFFYLFSVDTGNSNTYTSEVSNNKKDFTDLSKEIEANCEYNINSSSFHIQIFDKPISLVATQNHIFLNVFNLH